ncbi:MAG: bifunctional DNA-formamidopyrimidine glycosylase/DNA-(apurinic or apyrimidinic site) lyase [Candidatus Omnitrophica bacterium]|nr:bifunctional DNA-formamidopyrimidine glycosylase/DNA-(apurinic or apyrimidinic site) lyase [Candidatus Omnitrophota bacterium]
MPEVQTIKEYLSEKLVGEQIKNVVIKDERPIKGVSSEEFKETIKSKQVKEIFRRGKLLVFKLEEKLFLAIHLRINGILILSEKEERFARVIFDFGKNRLLNLCDSRVFAQVQLVSDWRKIPIVEKMGPEPLEMEKEEFAALFKGKKAKIKPLLMDQHFLAGIGNIYAQEAVFCAGINPESRANAIEPQRLEKLYQCLISILKKAISVGGSSVDVYLRPDGTKGRYESFLKVYQRNGQACFKCNSQIKRIVSGGRGTCFCPKCQK